MNAPATPLIPAIPPRDDFPGWLPAVLVKELRQALRAKGFVGLFLVCHLAAIIVFWWSIEINSASGLRGTFNWLNRAFWGLLNVVLLLVVPLRGLGSLRMEIDNKTLDLLVLTRLTAWRIVLGKWVALVAQSVLFLVAIMPYGVVRYFFGAVDLAGDMVTSGWLLLAGAMLSAACMWVSGLPKIFRVILPIVLFMSFQSVGVGSLFGAVLSGRGGLGGAMRTPAMGLTGLFLAGLAIVVFLGLAVRRIAPPAENHARPARLLGLFLLVGSAVVASGGYPGADSVMAFGFTAVALISAVELSRDCLPMRAHGSFWGGGRPWRRVFGRFMLPGWPSAALFAAVAIAPLALAMMLDPSRRPGSMTGFAAAWWLMLAWQALVFPAVLLSFLPASSTMRIGGTGYFVVQGLFGTISLLAASNSAGYLAGENFARTLDAICQLLPVFSFWLGINSAKTGFPAGNIAGQSIALVVLAVLVWRQSRIYWGTVARYDHAAAGRPAGSP